VKLASEDIARQVKRHRDKRRNRREGRSATPAAPPPIVVPEAPTGQLPAV
jgi:hypothetical protein